LSRTCYALATDARPQTAWPFSAVGAHIVDGIDAHNKFLARS